MQAGWFDDPSGRHQYRYFDGERWTEHVSDGGTTSTDAEGVQASQRVSATLPPPSVGSTGLPSSPVRPFGSSPIVPASGRKALWKRPWFLAAVAIVGVLVVAAALSGSGDDTEQVSDPDEVVDQEPVQTVSPEQVSDEVTGENVSDDVTGEATTDDTTADSRPDDAGTTVPEQPATTEPVSDHPDAASGPVPVGTAVLEGGSLVRVNVVTPNAPGDDFFEPEPGSTLTTIEVEACGGDDGFVSNSLYWKAFLDDGTEADSFLFADDFQIVGLRPGGCMRGVVSYEVPDGRAVTSVVMTGALFDEVARWTVEGAVPVTDRLQPDRSPDATPLGTTAEFGPGHTAVVRSVVDETKPLDDFFGPEDGRQFTQLDVELCAGSEPLPVNPMYWLGSTADSWLGGAAFAGSSLQPVELAAGRCVAGLVELDLPAGSVTTAVVLTNPLLDEIARWSVG